MVANAGKIPMVAQRWHNVILQPYTTPPPPLGSIPYNGTTIMAQRWDKVVLQPYTTLTQNAGTTLAQRCITTVHQHHPRYV